MATRIFSRSLLTAKFSLSSPLSRSFASLSLPTPLSSLSTSYLLRLRPLVAVAANFRNLSLAATSVRAFSTRQTTSSLNDPNPNWSNRPPKETILLDGCDFEHWLVVMEKPDENATRDEIIDKYIKTLATVVGSEEEARMKIYSVSTRCYFAFGALVSEELSYKLKELPGVRWVLPDSYLNVKEKDYGGEPFINGQAVPYDPKYHEEWIRNNARANERNRRNDRPRNFDRSRNFERRRENMQNRDFQPAMANQGMPNAGPNMAPPPPPPGNMGGPSNMGGMQQHNMGGMPPNNMGGVPPNMGGVPPNTMGRMPPNNMGALPPNMGGVPPNMGGGMPPTMGGMPPNTMGGMPPNNASNFQYRNGSNNGHVPYQSGPGPNTQFPNGYPTNTSGGNPYQTQNIPGREMPPPPNYK